MNPDEMMLLKWLVARTANKALSAAVLRCIKKGLAGAEHWMVELRQWSREGVEGATSALNAAERLYGKASK